MKYLTHSVQTYGETNEPVVVIDNFSSDLQALIDIATTRCFERRGQFYPGIRAPHDARYLDERMPLITSVLRNVFGINRTLDVVECNYSIVTTRPEYLQPIQCLPHFDGLDAGQFAFLHYLSDEDKGGTAFYRHRSTGFESLTADRYKIYKQSLEKEVARIGLPPQRYCNRSTEQFEQLMHVKAKRNRLIIYRSVVLHSGVIPDMFDFNDDPVLGRLTLNTFLQVKSPERSVLNAEKTN